MKRPSTSNLATTRSASTTQRGERGVALILTLGVLALVTLLLIAFVASMRVENAASKNFNEVIKARELARAGVDEAVGAIRMAAPVILPLSVYPNGSNYVSAPGIIYTWNQTFPGTKWIATPLYTTVNPNDPNPLQAKVVNLNTNFVITGSGTVYNVANPLNSQLWVGWSNVTVLATVNGFSQPLLVGRYAYWVDDESAKVDVNLANGRGVDSEGYTPAGLDLPSLGFGQLEAANLASYARNTRQLDTIESMMMVQSVVGNAPSISGSTFSNTQFYVTTHSTSPDVTPWGDQRLNLSNLVGNVATSPQDAVQRVYNFLAAEDTAFAAWTGSGNKFASKYNNLQQIAANIVDYVGYPGSDNIPTDQGGFGSTTAPNYLGLKETPYLNELVISNTFQASVDAANGICALTINSYPLVELWYMYTNSAGWAFPGGTQVPLQYALSMTIGGGFSPNKPTISSSSTIPGPTLIGANSYWVGPPAPIAPIWTTTASLTFSSGNQPSSVTVSLNPSTVTAIFTTQSAQSPGNLGRMDYAVIGLTNNTVVSVPVPVSGSGPIVSGVWASQCDDPRVKPISYDWQLDPSPSLNSMNASPYNRGTAPIPAGSPQSDGDTSCHIVSVNLPNTTGAGRLRGAMTPGELAFIHTGAPWRTFSLQPWPPAANPSEPGPPDWAMLDWFSAPNTLAIDVAGRVNINQAIRAVTPLPRLFNPAASLYPGPLCALLTNLSASGYAQFTAAFNVTNYPSSSAYYVQNPTLLGPNFCPNAYTMVGEIANTRGLSNFGATPKSVLETPVRDIANIITTRSDTFTIWCLAQAVKKVDLIPGHLQVFTPGTDIVTGEAKVQAIVERYEDASTTPPTIKFRTLYYRYYYQ